MEEYDINLKQFVNGLFVQEPQARSSYELTLPDGVRIQDFLAYFLVLGAKELYNKQLGELLPYEIEKLRKYLHSIGWDVEYKVDKRSLNSTLVNEYKIDFSPLQID